MGGGEGDAELHRRQGEALLEDRVLRVEGLHRLAPGAVVGGGFQLLDDLADDAVGDGHVVGRDGRLFPGAGIEVALAHVERIEPGHEPDLVHRPLDADHPLRPAEAAEGGVGDRVGLQAAGMDAGGLEVIGVVGMEHRPVGDGGGEIAGIAAAHDMRKVRSVDRPVRGKAEIVVDPHLVALAGHLHVVVAVEAAFRRPPGLCRDEGRDGGEQRRLTLLAAEAAAHAPELHRHGVVRDPQHLGDVVLDLGGMLGGGAHEDVTVFQRRGGGDLAFEVEMILAADFDPALHPHRRRVERGRRIAEPHLVSRQKIIAGGIGLGDRVVDGDRGGQVLVFDHRQLRGPPGGQNGIGRDGEDRLTDILHDRPVTDQRRKDRVVAEHRRIVVLAGNVVGGEHHGDARRRAHGGKVEPGEPGMSARRHGDVDLQRPRQFRLVVGVAGGAGDVLHAAVMGGRRRDAAPDPRLMRRRPLVQRRDLRLAAARAVLDAGLVHHAAPPIAWRSSASGPMTAMRPDAAPACSS